VQVLALWIHTLALVIVLGYYGILGRITIPALERSLDLPAQVKVLVAIERRALPLVLLSVVLFVVTGTYLLVVNPQYAGLGHFFATTWSSLMVIKHGIVIVLVVLGVILDWLIRDVAQETDDPRRKSGLRRIRLGAEGATALGALAILLTAAAQLSA
jgi:uncharacterized membrane protein